MEKEKNEERQGFDEIKAMTERLEAANKETAVLLEKQKELNAHAIIAGETEAGTPAKELTQEEKSVQSARDMLKGTGYDDMLFPVEK